MNEKIRFLEALEVYYLHGNLKCLMIPQFWLDSDTSYLRLEYLLKQN